MGISRKRRVMWEDDAGDLIELGGLDESQGQVMDLIDGRLGDPRVGVTSLADELIPDSAGELVADLSGLAMPSMAMVDDMWARGYEFYDEPAEGLDGMVAAERWLDREDVFDVMIDGPVRRREREDREARGMDMT